MNIDKGTLLQGGKYEIQQILGEGGFGITYLAIQKSLNRKVAIKEFFMKDYCRRDSETTLVSMGTDSSRHMIEQYKRKFIKEAQTISNLHHNQIIPIFDVFEENGTAYYVMEYLSGGDLSVRIPQGGMGEGQALYYIRQIASALDFIHQNNILHLDIKPANILFRNQETPVLIDFGVSKHYDKESGGETSDTPVGISEGFAPLEQYETDGIKDFSPTTDIYALGATFYCLLTGKKPPSASKVFNGGLPALPASVSKQSVEAIKMAMESRKAERLQDVQSFLKCLSKPEKVQERPKESDDRQKPKPEKPAPTPAKTPVVRSYAMIAVSSIMGIVLACILFMNGPEKETQKKKDITIEEKIKEEKELALKKKKTLDATNNTKEKESSGNSGQKDNEAKDAVQPRDAQKSYVDLGLSVLWAQYSIMDDALIDNLYFSWGSTLPSSSYDIANCSTWEKDLKNISGNSVYDAATNLLGSGWRIPTKDEMHELIGRCQWRWKTKGGLEGYEITGPNGNSIFMPAWGHQAKNKRFFHNERGCYQTAESNDNKFCWILQFSQSGIKIIPSMRYQGNSIWAVKDK